MQRISLEKPVCADCSVHSQTYNVRLDNKGNRVFLEVRTAKEDEISRYLRSEGKIAGQLHVLNAAEYNDREVQRPYLRIGYVKYIDIKPDQDIKSRVEDEVNKLYVENKWHHRVLSFLDLLFD